jgi:hypothetical protein
LKGEEIDMRAETHLPRSSGLPPQQAGAVAGQAPILQRGGGARPPAEIDEGLIREKWQAEGGEAKLGRPLRAVQSALGGRLKYQQFQSGAIFASASFGAVMVGPEIFGKWSGLSPSLQSTVGCPIGDGFRVTRPAIGTADCAYFERGMIVARSTGQAFEVHGRIYERYRDLNDVRGVLEYPQSDEEAAAGGGKRSRFTHGEIYWKSATGAAEVHGAIGAKWHAHGGPGGLLGYPVADEARVMSGTRELGRFSRFEKGAIYWSSRTGAHEVHGAILAEWENVWGGATGPLGFPTSDETSTPTSGGRFSNFEKGCLVWHGSGAFAGAHAFTKLEFYLDRFATKGDDGFARGGQDLYVKADIKASTGQSFAERMPRSGTYGSDEEIDKVLVSVPAVQGDLVVTVKLDGWDSDTFGDERLGLLDERYSVDNLWGVLEDASHWRGNFLAVYKFRNPMPADLSDFREKLFWQFENFKTERLTYAQYAQTFRDVANDESALWNPFDRAYYHLAYKGVAGGGNCFGMCLESIYAQLGRSIYSEPIGRVPPTNGNEPSPTQHAELINEINIKHGYQTGAGCIDYFVAQFALGRTHNPKDAFIRSREMFRRGDYPVMVVTPGTLSVGGHVVRPYGWDTSDPDRWIMKIADPNVPEADREDDLDGRCIIEVNPKTNNFRYLHRDDEVYSGSDWTGGRMYPIPFSALCRQPRTPFWEVLGLLLSGAIIILGEDGESQQIGDGAGRTFYEPGVAGGPSLWEHIRRDSRQRIANMARVPLFQSGRMPEIYYMTGIADQTLTHEVRGQRTGQYQWAMRSPLASAAVTSPTAGGAAETISAARFGGEAPDVALAMPRTGKAKRIDMAFAGRAEGQEATGAFELSGLAVEPGQGVKLRLTDRGREIEVENSGPATAFDLTLRAAAGGRAVVTKRGVALAGGGAMKLRPADWSAANLGRAPVRIEQLSRPGGDVIRRFEI